MAMGAFAVLAATLFAFSLDATLTDVQRRQLDPPARERILQRDFGGSLGRGPAPGRLDGVRRSGTSSPR